MGFRVFVLPLKFIQFGSVNNSFFHEFFQGRNIDGPLGVQGFVIQNLTSEFDASELVCNENGVFEMPESSTSLEKPMR